MYVYVCEECHHDQHVPPENEQPQTCENCGAELDTIDAESDDGF